MVDTLFALLLSILGSQNLPSDPYIFTPENEAVIELQSRLEYGLIWYSGDQLETYVKLGEPLFIEKEDVPRDDLHQGYKYGKPKEELVTEERWYYPDPPEPFIFQPDRSGQYRILRRPQMLMQMASYVYSEPVKYHYDYGKEKLHYHMAVNVWWSFPQRYDYKDIELELTLPIEEIDSGYTWRIVVQDSSGRELRRDSTLVRLDDSLKVSAVSKSWIYRVQVVSDTLIDFQYTVTGYKKTYYITYEILTLDGKKGELKTLEERL